MTFRSSRRLVRRRDAGQVADFAEPRATVESLRIPAYELFQGAVHEHFDKQRRVTSTHVVAGLAVGRDRSDDRDHAVLGEEAGHEPEPANLQIAIGFGEAEVRSEGPPDLVAIEYFCGTSSLRESLCQTPGRRGLACARRSCQPYGCSRHARVYFSTV